MTYKIVFPLIILVTLLTLTYLLDQRDIGEKLKVISTHQLVKEDLSSLTSLKVGSVVLTNRVKGFVTAHPTYEVDQEVLNQWWGKLKELTTIRPLTGKEKSLLLDKKIFHKKLWNIVVTTTEKKVIHYRLGEKLLYDEGFYMSRREGDKEEWFIVKHIGPNDGVYESEEDRINQKFGEVKMLFSIHKETFYNQRLIKQQENLLKIAIANNWNRPFTIDFSLKKTDPEVIKGVAYDEKGIERLMAQLFSIKAMTLFFMKDNDLTSLKDKSAELLLTFEDRKLILQLYRQFQGRAGYFVTSSFEKNILFELESLHGSLFFLNVQDFWQKQIFSDNDPIGTTKELFTIQFGKKGPYELAIPASDEFQIEMVSKPKREVKPHPFRELFQLLVGTGRKANRISEITDQQKKRLLQNDKSIRLKIRGHDLLITFNGNEILMTHIIFGYQLHYLFGDNKPFTYREEDFFYPPQP